mgnify:CR=1 FL=1
MIVAGEGATGTNGSAGVVIVPMNFSNTSYAGGVEWMNNDVVNLAAIPTGEFVPR